MMQSQASTVDANAVTPINLTEDEKEEENGRSAEVASNYATLTNVFRLHISSQMSRLADRQLSDLDP